MRGAKLPLVQRLAGAGRLAERAHVHVECWLTLEERGPTWEASLGRFNAVLQHTLHAHRVAAVVELWTLLEDHRAQGVSLLRLAREVDAEPGACAAQTPAVQALAAWPAFAKVRRLRHEALAHRSDALALDDVFREVRLSPNETRDLTRATIAATGALLARRNLALSLAWEPAAEMRRLLSVTAASVEDDYPFS